MIEGLLNVYFVLLDHVVIPIPVETIVFSTLVIMLSDKINFFMPCKM